MSFNGAIENKDEWFQDREAYERNFNSLQEQLLTVMVEKQQLGMSYYFALFLNALFLSL